MNKPPARPARNSRSGSRGRRYEHPLPDPVAIVAKLEQHGVPVDFESLAVDFELRSEPQRRALRRRLKEMSEGGQLLINRRGEICLIGKIDAVTGRVSAHRDGYGFLITDDGSPDVYLSQEQMRHLLDSDRIAVRLDATPARGRRTGTVVEIIARGRTAIVGRYRRDGGVGYVAELSRGSRHFVIPDRHRGGAREGQIVKAEISSYPDDQHEALARVVKILGSPEEDPGIATEAAIEMLGLPSEWTPAVLRAAAHWGGEVRPADKTGREDLRDTPLVTIDGSDARDFDDAVYAEPRGDGWRLIVAIADVSHYVSSGSPLDSEAEKRATSVYFPDRVVPMLPEALSNGLCSLNPGVDRLCMVCDMHVSALGEIGRARFYRAVMRSAARLTYEEVQDAYDGDSASRQRLAHVMPQIAELYAVYGALSAARGRRGALDLDLPEAKIELDDAGTVRKVSMRMRRDSHRLVEECMIAANVEAGRFLRRRRTPSLYRVHAAPDPEKFDDLRLLLQSLGLRVGGQAATRTRELNHALRAFSARPDYPMLAMAVLRTMSQAVYQPANIGHFGLALAVYTHFTSPIRRYPDLLVHRAIGQTLDGLSPDAVEPQLPRLEVLGRTCSDRERRADEAARYVEARYKCAYVKAHVGSTMPGVIAGVTHFGLFVTLRDLNVDGLVHVSALRNDYYHLEHGGLRLKGERTAASYGLGDELDVRIDRVDVDEAKIDLSPAGMPPPVRAPARHPFRRRRG